MSVVRAGRSSAPMRSGIVFSAIVHTLVVVTALWYGSLPEAPRPPVYRVELVGAPAGPRQAGVVKEAVEPTRTAADIAGAERVAEEKVVPTPSTAKKVLPSAKATPSTTRSKKAGSKSATATTRPSTAAPKAGAGAQGGKGADVANLSIQGIEFPYPGYLTNIVRQLTLSWTPRRVSAALVSEVKFTIRRDGSVVAIEVVKRSGDRSYDLDAMGAIEAVGSTRGFGPLPTGWVDDVLIVYFTFDYALRPN